MSPAKKAVSLQKRGRPLGSGVLAFLLMVIFLNRGGATQKQEESVPDQTKLPEILQKTRDYCRRLEGAVFNFVCLEEITEKIKRPKSVRQEIVPGWREEGGIPQAPRFIPHNSLTEKSEKNQYLYEYQLIRQKGQNEEKRTLLEKNSLKKFKKDSQLEGIRLYYQKIAFGPIDLLSGLQQLRYDFKIVKEEILGQDRLAVIEAVPKTLIMGYIPSGKIWVRESDCAILKIEWNEHSLANYKDVEERAALLKATPQIVLTTELGVEKNGIRFPSRVIFEEAYIDKKGKKLIASEVTIAYKDYKFFTVEVDVKY